MFTLDDTIAAVATAPGGAARGIVRISGPDAVSIVRRCFFAGDSTEQWTQATEPLVISGLIRFAQDENARDHESHVKPCNDDANSRAVAADVFLWPTNSSYTRQPVAEIHTIGSPPLLEAVLQSVVAAGARLARPGEFTLRAFLSGRIDLTQAEAVLGVIDAADGRQLQTALEQLAGGLSRPLARLRNDLLDLLADLEAGLDFVEDDIRFIAHEEIERRLAAAQQHLAHIALQLRNRTASSNSPRVVLVGWPNVGKSSLFNALVGNSAAIVSPQAGTTRDYLTATVKLGTIEVELIDTAGISLSEEASSDIAVNCAMNSADTIDAAAQQAAAAIHRQADLRLLCIDSSRELNSGERRQLSSIVENHPAVKHQPQARDDAGNCATEKTLIKTLVVATKCDDRQSATAISNFFGIAGQESIELPIIATSGRTGFGLDNLRAKIAQAFATQPADSQIVTSTAARASDSVRRAAGSIDRAVELNSIRAGEELLAAEIRTALAELGMVVGAVYTDDLLDRIFSRFCIGK
ncbi:MAG TPA: GTPase [Pirellulales bacterium]|jgi:tRNA modification GTPase